MKEGLTKYIAVSLALIVALCSCRKEERALPSDQAYTVIHYTATVNSGLNTRASLTDDKQYIFEQGDRLFITSGENMYGFLTLVSGIGSTSATFEGDLTCVDDFEPTDATSLSATLVSINDRIHTCASGKITATSYPDDELASSFADAVSKYSEFTATSTYADQTFTLAQQSSFLLFDVALPYGEDASTDATVVLKNGETNLISASAGKITVGGVVVASFVAAFPSETDFSNASVTVNSYEFSLSSPGSDGKLAANNYYTISRSTFTAPDVFTIEALEDNVDITFNFANNGIQYNTSAANDPDFDNNWQDYSSVAAITLSSAGDCLYWRGQKTNYGENTNSGSRKLMDATGAYAVYGNMLSLTCDSSYNPSTPSAAAFWGAFKDDKNIRTLPDERLTLPSTTAPANFCRDMFLNCTGITYCPVDELPATDVYLHSYWAMFKGCTNMITVPTIGATNYNGDASFEEMFSGCTSITTAPELPETDIYAWCYNKMFLGCTSLVNAPVLPATTLKTNCYQNMFNGCTSLQTITCLATSISASGCLTNWVSGVPSTGTFYKDSNMDDWTTGTSGIPSGWTVEDYSN